MAAGPDTLLRYIQQLVVRRQPDEATDADLVARFVSGRDERAFAALVDRHGPLVLQVCRRVLGDGDDTEDAFQAVFLVLARKAATLGRREALPGWLHGVARRVALKARSARARRWREARPLAAPPADPRPDPLAEVSARELLLIVDEELRQLPEVYRLPVILCCLEGRSLDEAARQLGWTPGSVKGRLERGRARLHERLVRRGLTLSAALAAAEVSRGAALAIARLAAGTVRGAVAFATRRTAAAEGVSAGAATLAGEMVKTLAPARLKVTAALLLAAGLLTTGLALYRAAQQPTAAAPQARLPSFLPEDEAALAPPAAPADRQPVAPGAEADAPVAVSGRVLNPGGKPLAGARLYVGYSARRYPRDFQRRQTAYPLRATSAADGRFQFAFARSELDARWLDDARPAVVAVADGYGPAWAEVGEPGQGAGLSLKLVDDLPVEGRILDQNRQPIAGARVLVLDVTSDSEEGVTRFLQGDFDSWSPRSWRGLLPGQPPGVTTDADGRFRLTGLGRDRVVRLALEGSAISHSTLAAVTRPAGATPFFAGVNGAAFEHVALPSRPIRGVVRDRATGKPVAGVKISASGYPPTAVTDEDGRYELPGCSKTDVYFVLAQPQTGQPYFAALARVPDGPGLDPLTANLELVGGIRFQGRVTDRETQRPPGAGVVEYYPLFPNPHSSGITSGTETASSALIRPDGSHSLVVLPGPGVVCVAASPRNSYAVARVDADDLANFFHDGMDHGEGQCLYTATQKGGRSRCCLNAYHALSLINPDEGTELPALDITLHPARPLKGTVVGPDGQPLTGVRVIGLTALPDEEVLDSASFTVAGLNPRRSRDLIFHHKEKNLGKVLTVRGDETEPLTVPLDPCGSVTGRMVDQGGNPVPGVTVCFSRASIPRAVVAETDGGGRFRAALVPGERHVLMLSNSRRLLRDVGPLEVEPGRSKDLGDLPLSD
jgi:RNA polymerase sigma factor (sigma-70 family)